MNIYFIKYSYYKCVWVNLYIRYEVTDEFFFSPRMTIKQPLVETAALPPVNWFCAFVDRQSGVPAERYLGSELHLLPSARTQGLITAATETALMLGRVPIHLALLLKNVSARLETVPSHTIHRNKL